jgi:hypothetical protein
MKAKGGVCATLAAVGSVLLNRNMIRLVSPTATYSPPLGIINKYGARESGYMVLMKDMIDLHYDYEHKRSAVNPNGVTVYDTLQSVLAHELDHLINNPHLAGNLFVTANEHACDDIPG